MPLFSHISCALIGLFQASFVWIVLSGCLLFFPVRELKAQSKNAATDERVQSLYAEAKTAEYSGDLNGAIAKYESILHIAPRLAPAYNNLGSLYLKQHEFSKAAAVLEKGLKIDPAMSSASALLGIALYEMGEYAAARPKLEAALRANPKDNDAEMILANDLIKLGELVSAATHLQQVARRQPQNQEAWYLLGGAYMKLSEQALAKLNEIDPNSVLVHLISGEVMESMKNYDGALLEYKKAEELAPQRPGTHYFLGNAYLSLRSWDLAAQQFQVELAIDPSNCRAQWKLGNILLEQHLSADEALSHVDQALAMCPNLVQARADRARALLQLERPADALKDLQVAEKSDPSEPGIHFLMAKALRSLGRTQEAQAEMQIFSKLDESARAATAERARRVLQNKEPPN